MYPSSYPTTSPTDSDEYILSTGSIVGIILIGSCCILSVAYRMYYDFSHPDKNPNKISLFMENPENVKDTIDELISIAIDQIDNKIMV